MKIILPLMLGLVFLLGCNTRPRVEATEYRVKTIWRGVCKIDEWQVSDGEAPGMFRDLAKLPYLGVESEIVELGLGTKFGVFFEVTGYPRGGISSLTTKIIYPTPGIKSTSTGKLEEVYERTYELPVGSVNLFAFRLKSKNELIPGVWRFEFWNGSIKLGEEKFLLKTP